MRRASPLLLRDAQHGQLIVGAIHRPLSLCPDSPEICALREPMELHEL